MRFLRTFVSRSSESHVAQRLGHRGDGLPFNSRESAFLVGIEDSAQ